MKLTLQENLSAQKAASWSSWLPCNAHIGASQNEQVATSTSATAWLQTSWGWSQKDLTRSQVGKLLLVLLQIRFLLTKQYKKTIIVLLHQYYCWSHLSSTDWFFQVLSLDFYSYRKYLSFLFIKHLASCSLFCNNTDLLTYAKPQRNMDTLNYQTGIICLLSAEDQNKEA